MFNEDMVQRMKNGCQYPGGFSGALQDDNLKKAWENLTPEEKEGWKEKARVETNRQRSAFVANMERAAPLVSTPENAAEADFPAQGPVVDPGYPVGVVPVGRAPWEDYSDNEHEHERSASRASSNGSKGDENTNVGLSSYNPNHVGFGPFPQESQGFNYRPATNALSGFGAVQITDDQSAALDQNLHDASSAAEVVSNTPESIIVENCSNGASEFDVSVQVNTDDAGLTSVGAEGIQITAEGEGVTIPADSPLVITIENQIQTNGPVVADKNPKPENTHYEAGGQMCHQECTSACPDVVVPAAETLPVATQQPPPAAVDAALGFIVWNTDFRDAYVAQLKLPQGSRGIGRGLHLLPDATALIGTLQSYLNN